MYIAKAKKVIFKVFLQLVLKKNYKVRWEMRENRAVLFGMGQKSNSNRSPLKIKVQAFHNTMTTSRYW
jgi:hypothetical protein